MTFLSAVALYVAVGLAVAIAFVTVGLPQVLRQPMQVSLGARILFVPGLTALWPYVLIRWRRARHPQ
jgi:hypothetical protein